MPEDISVDVKEPVHKGLNPWLIGSFLNRMSVLGCRALAFLFGEATAMFLKGLFERAVGKEEVSEVD